MSRATLTHSDWPKHSLHAAPSLCNPPIGSRGLGVRRVTTRVIRPRVGAVQKQLQAGSHKALSALTRKKDRTYRTATKHTDRHAMDETKNAAFPDFSLPICSHFRAPLRQMVQIHPSVQTAPPVLHPHHCSDTRNPRFRGTFVPSAGLIKAFFVGWSTHSKSEAANVDQRCLLVSSLVPHQLPPLGRIMGCRGSADIRRD